MADTAINVDGVYQKATDYLTTENINTPKNGVRPLPEWGQIVSTDPIGEWTLQGAARPPREAAVASLPVPGLVHPGEAGWQLRLARCGRHQPGRQHHRLLQSPVRPRPAELPTAGTHSSSAMRFQLPADVIIGTIFNFRTTTPFSARAGVDLNGDGVSTTDYVPGTTKNMGNRDNAAMMAAVNAYRATLNLPALPESQIDKNTLLRACDVRVSKAINLGGGRKIEVIAAGLQPVRPQQPRWRRQQLSDQRARGDVRPDPDRAAAAGGRSRRAFQLVTRAAGIR